jgi:hypothetical protein
VRHRGRTYDLEGVLVTDSNEVARALNAVLDGGTSPGLVGLELPAGHEVSPDDVAALDRAMIRFR